MKFIKEFIAEWKRQAGWMQAYGCVFPWERAYWNRKGK